jgi:hypothetical protein
MRSTLYCVFTDIFLSLKFCSCTTMCCDVETRYFYPIYSVRTLADLMGPYAQILPPTLISYGHRIRGIVVVENLGHV